jgi:hypothetical protein
MMKTVQQYLKEALGSYSREEDAERLLMRLYLERRGLLDDFERWQIELFTKEDEDEEDN